MKILHSVTASTNDSSIVNKIYSVMMDYEYGYDPDMADINTMLQELTSKGVHVDTSDAFKKAWISAHNKAERKTWGSSMDSYHYDSLTPRELEAIENYDTEYWEYVKDHPFNLEPLSITSSTSIKGFTPAHIDDPDDEESEWYDWWNDVDGYLLRYDDNFKKIIYDFRDKYGMPKNMSDDLCDKLADVIFDYVKNNLERLGIDPNENTDQDYSEFAHERMVEWLVEPYLYGDFWDDYTENGENDVQACDQVTASMSSATEPNAPDTKKSKLVRGIIKRAKEVRDYFQSHNNNLNRRQEQILDDLSDGIDNQSISAIRDAIENLKYNSKNMRSGQYELVIDLYNDFNLAGGKFEGMGYPEADDIEGCDNITGYTKSRYMATMVSASSSDSRYDENDELYKYYVAGYFDSRLRGLDDNLATNDFDEAINKAHELASNGDYVKITNEITGKSHTYSPDEWMEAIDFGEVPSSTKELY